MIGAGGAVVVGADGAAVGAVGATNAMADAPTASAVLALGLELYHAAVDGDPISACTLVSALVSAGYSPAYLVDDVAIAAVVNTFNLTSAVGANVDCTSLDGMSPLAWWGLGPPAVEPPA